MYSKVLSAASLGMSGYLVEVETHIANGLPVFKIVGLPDKAVAEAKERVAVAIKSSGFTFPLKRITVNLAPSEIPKHGPIYDLPIAVGILIASSQINPDQIASLKNTIFCGELGLNGYLRKTPALPILLQVAIDSGIRRAIIPVSQDFHHSISDKIKIDSVNCLKTCVYFLTGRIRKLPQFESSNSAAPAADKAILPDISSIRGNESLKRAALICASGRHHLVMSGPPGCGKTMISKCIAGLLPDLDSTETIELQKIYSLSREDPPRGRPFRNPHHTSSLTSIFGGGQLPCPGEISLAHSGILFLDEFPEFPRSIINTLKLPLEEKSIRISRKFGVINFPANFLLIAAMNPCPCGFLGHPVKKCTCRLHEINSYRKRISNAIWDRIDMDIAVQAACYGDVNKRENKGQTEKMRDIIHKTWEIQKKRGVFNADLSLEELQTSHSISHSGRLMIKDAFEKLSLSTRGYLKVIRVARTIADLEGKLQLTDEHIAEAISYREKE